jgi:hypothetical protein
MQGLDQVYLKGKTLALKNTNPKFKSKGHNSSILFAACTRDLSLYKIAGKSPFKCVGGILQKYCFVLKNILQRATTPSKVSESIPLNCDTYH